MYEFMQPLIR